MTKDRETMTAAVVNRKRREVIQGFRKAGATSRDHARPIEELDPREERMLRVLQRRGVLVEAEPGRFYLDERRAKRDARVRVMLVLGMIVIVGTLWFAATLLLRGR